MSALDHAFACMSASDIRAGLAAKEFSAREIAESSLARVRALDGATHAFLETTEALALEQAAKLDAAVASGEADGLGALAGVPVAFKDNMNLAGTHTTCSSAMLANYVSPYTATCVARAIEAGGIPLGKLNMDEFAFGSSTETSAFGPSKNPWDLERVPGGSSGGSAAAVGAGLATMTLGSDTGGSIRQPGSFCGAVAVKPTYGVVSRYGVVAFGSSLDQVGPFTRSVADAALAMNAIAGRDPLDCTSQDIRTDYTANLDAGVRGMRIGIVPAFMEAKGLTAEVKAKVEEAAEHLRELGAELVEVDLPNAQAAMSAYYVLGPCEAFSNLARFDSVRYGYCDPGHKDLGGQYEASRAKGFGAEARRRIMLGSYLLSAGVYDTYYYPAQQVRTLITQDYARAYEQVDCILAPVAPRTSFKFGEVSDPTDMYLSDMFTISINIAGNGGMSLPVGLGADTNLPVGVQLISPQFKDESMLRVAAALETVYGPAPVAPLFREGADFKAPATIPDAADAVPGVDLPGLATESDVPGGVHQASSATERELSERLGAAEVVAAQVEGEAE
ncbi:MULTISPECIES: Asp-tRNA(Asn)/Glu-tRNA(Gln) amidotransferase subunit GatA [Gordonibacter]|uniref:Glutamyl-tRNA(Gln) amidotransferase subunit A n=1 Tax=Gordonibacter faecis TaxID=3047475 RepID=A0ABT7DTA4_9ACTN|nr:MULTISPECIES: Asp-tRNA(Asn)/Glu-tRNA(Gln) amidotransferase subunit GatA [unclassified Gordonibacter]MDJ1651766.1 Asp-tRNA(Asn)/Glu-tRNA(Gln) amidotransferase subunit GatA [Gordonibacter sp. KGMB12511]HIW75699.1 Asp-tRNA(Asn)/Glu-tRNA(Gln) amidotransferase subunit GatA [Candidatus Gordonibacter avicola]